MDDEIKQMEEDLSIMYLEEFDIWCSSLEEELKLNEINSLEYSSFTKDY